jgi:MFS family permease
VWGIVAFLFLFAFFHRAAPGVFAKELMQAFGATGAIVGLLSATYYYSYAGLMIPAGVLLDRLGVRWVGAAGGVVMAAGTMLMALASETGLLFAGRFLVGAGASVMFVGALKIAAAWFSPGYFATLSAATAAVGVLGGLVATVPMAWLAAALGWRGALTTVGVVTLAGAIGCLALVRDQPGDHRDVASPAPGWAAVLAGLGRVLRNRHTWPPFIAFFFLYSADARPERLRRPSPLRGWLSSVLRAAPSPRPPPALRTERRRRHIRRRMAAG